MERLPRNLFVALQQVEFVLVILTSTMILDKVFVSNLHDRVPLENGNQFYYLFGLLVAYDENGNPKPGTELLKVSFGFLLTLKLLAAITALFYCFKKMHFMKSKLLPLCQVTSTVLLLSTIALIPARPVIG